MSDDSDEEIPRKRPRKNWVAQASGIVSTYIHMRIILLVWCIHLAFFILVMF
jgi:hypothetical protein